jgi:hypothetical protein
MPYQITKLKNGKYKVILKDTGQLLSKATTLEKAKKQIRYLGMMEHMRGGGIHELDNNIQSVLFGKDKNTEKKADAVVVTSGAASVTGDLSHVLKHEYAAGQGWKPGCADQGRTDGEVGHHQGAAGHSRHPPHSG